MGSLGLATIINNHCLLQWSLIRTRYKMKISLILVLAVAAVSYGSPTTTTTTTTTEHQRTRRSANGCPYQVEIKCGGSSKPDSGPYKLYKKYYGTYTIQTGTFDGKDWYLSSNGRYAIWYNDGRWRVGTVGNKGSNKGVFYSVNAGVSASARAFGFTASAGPFGLSLSPECPFYPFLNWKYYVPGINQWVDAGYDGMHISKAS